MAFGAAKCPNCAASYNPATSQCEYCGSYILTSNQNFVDYSNMKIELPKKPKDDSGRYPGIYVYGRLLGQGEKPITLGVANYMTGLVSAGGKLLLTTKSLSFSAHGFNVGKKETRIDLRDITNVKVSANLLISQHISVTANGITYKFVVYHGKEWVEKIQEAMANYEETVEPVPVASAAPQPSENYIVELQQLKQLLDMGVITEAEFTEKKKILLGL